jgi:hypothetical protein
VRSSQARKQTHFADGLGAFGAWAEQLLAESALQGGRVIVDQLAKAVGA